MWLMFYTSDICQNKKYIVLRNCLSYKRVAHDAFYNTAENKNTILIEKKKKKKTLYCLKKIKFLLIKFCIQI